MIKRAAIIGDGAMGTLASLLLSHNGVACSLWSAFEEQAADLQRHRENRRFLPGFPLPKSLKISTEAQAVTNGAELVVLAVPSRHLRKVLAGLKDALPPEVPYVSVVKGIEAGTLRRPSQIVADVLGRRRLVGPCLSHEVASRLPATVVVASDDAAAAREAQAAFATPWFRVYTSEDMAGLELGGALKNIIAIAAGICDGLELGNNAKAALITRGLVEMTRLGAKLGAKRETFAGLAGLGDLVTTCMSSLSRNHHVGEEIGRGRRLDDILEEMGRVEAEGVETTRSAAALAAQHNVEMPITQEVYAVLFQDKPAPDGLADLMSRAPKQEH